MAMKTQALIKTKAKTKKTPPVVTWVLIDAQNQVLGRLAVRIANILTGKSKPNYARHLDVGDHVVVINAAKIRTTGKKLTDKTYRSFSGYPGGFKEWTLEDAIAKKPTFPLWHAVRGMLPKNSLGYHMLNKLKIYVDAQHPHAAQKPKALN